MSVSIIRKALRAAGLLAAWATFSADTQAQSACSEQCAQEYDNICFTYGEICIAYTTSTYNGQCSCGNYYCSPS